MVPTTLQRATHTQGFTHSFVVIFENEAGREADLPTPCSRRS